MKYFTGQVLLIGFAVVCSCLPIPASESETRNDDLIKRLNKAAETGNEQMLLKAIDDGADVNNQDYAGWTALCVAVWNRHDNIARILIDNGANVNAKLNSKWTALHMAAENGHIGLVKLLIEKGANVNATTYEGWTPLDLAKSQERPEAVEFLIKINQEKNIPNVLKQPVKTESLANTKPAAITYVKNADNHFPLVWLVLVVGLAIFAAVLILVLVQKSQFLRQNVSSDESDLSYGRLESY